MLQAEPNFPEVEVENRKDPVDSNNKKKKNPFYKLLIWVGVVFAVTATSYGVMTVNYLRASEEITESSAPADTYHPLFRFLDESGFDLMPMHY